MGTSNIYYGPRDKNHLIPNDYDNESDDESFDNQSLNWQIVKSNMSKFLKSGGKYSSTRNIASQYIQAMGGSKMVISRSNSGIRAGSNIVSFFEHILNEGIETTLNDLKIEYEGKPATEILSKLVNVLAPDSDTKEDVAARQAMMLALAKIFSYLEEHNMNIDKINDISPTLISKVVVEYISSYIWISMMANLGSRLEIYISNAKDAYNLELEFKNMIINIVEIEYNKNEKILSLEPNLAMSMLYEKCVNVLEVII